MAGPLSQPWRQRPPGLGQWDNAPGFVDACPTCTLYHPDGRLRTEHVERLKEIARDAGHRGRVVHLALFARESWNEGIRLDPAVSRRAVTELTRELAPFRNPAFQVWNEHSERVLEHGATMRAVDPKRLVTSSPGYAGQLADGEQNAAMDYLTPHTTRGGRHWEIAPREVALLLERCRKPVVDDEPARTGRATSVARPGRTSRTAISSASTTSGRRADT